MIAIIVPFFIVAIISLLGLDSSFPDSGSAIFFLFVFGGVVGIIFTYWHAERHKDHYDYTDLTGCMAYVAMTAAVVVCLGAMVSGNSRIHYYPRWSLGALTAGGVVFLLGWLRVIRIKTDEQKKIRSMMESIRTSTWRERLEKMPPYHRQWVFDEFFFPLLQSLESEGLERLYELAAQFKALTDAKDDIRFEGDISFHEEADRAYKKFCSAKKDKIRLEVQNLLNFLSIKANKTDNSVFDETPIHRSVEFYEYLSRLAAQFRYGDPYLGSYLNKYKCTDDERDMLWNEVIAPFMAKEEKKVPAGAFLDEEKRYILLAGLDYNRYKTILDKIRRQKIQDKMQNILTNLWIEFDKCSYDISISEPISSDAKKAFSDILHPAGYGFFTEDTERADTILDSLLIKEEEKVSNDLAAGTSDDKFYIAANRFEVLSKLGLLVHHSIPYALFWEASRKKAELEENLRKSTLYFLKALESTAHGKKLSKNDFDAFNAHLAKLTGYERLWVQANVVKKFASEIDSRKYIKTLENRLSLLAGLDEAKYAEARRTADIAAEEAAKVKHVSDLLDSLSKAAYARRLSNDDFKPFHTFLKELPEPLRKEVGDKIVEPFIAKIKKAADEALFRQNKETAVACYNLLTAYNKNYQRLYETACSMK